MPLDLQKLVESRDAAQKAYEDFITPIVDAGQALTEEQDARRTELRGAVTEFDNRIDEVHEDRKREEKLAEVRQATALRTGLGSGSVESVDEPTVYGKGSDNSYFLDLVWLTAGEQHANYNEARERLNRANHQVAKELVLNKSSEKRSRITQMLAEHKRKSGQDGVRQVLRSFDALGRSEYRSGMDTTSGSGGSFVTPIYFIQEYAPYREAGRAFADQCNKQDLPPYGMTVNIPGVTGPAGVASQGSQNSAIQETDPTAGYLSGNLGTYAGQVTVSQQLLDRAGPGFQFDALVFDQLQRDHAPKIDTAVLTAALAGAGTIAYTDSTGFHLTATSGAGGFYSKVSGAKSAVRTAAGVFLNPTHLFVAPPRWEYMSAWADSSGRPVIVPDLAGAFNAAAAGNRDGDAGLEGATGYRLNGLAAYQDNNIPTPTVGADQAIIGDLAEVYVFEGAPVPRVLPQTLAGNLSVLIQLYSYMTTIVRYPHAVQTITGSGMSTIAF